MCPRCEWQPPLGSEHLSAPPRAGHELQIECVRREPLVGQSPIKGSTSLCSRKSGFGARRCLFSTSVISIGRPYAACNLRLEMFGPPVLYQLRHGDASQEVFIFTACLATRWSSFKRTTSLREGCLHATIAPNAFSSRTSVVRGLSPKVGSSAVRLAAKRCPQRDRRNNTPLGQRSPGDWTRCFKLWRRRPCSAMSEACYRLAELVASYSPSTDRISSTFEHGWLPLLVLFWQRPSGPASQ